MKEGSGLISDSKNARRGIYEAEDRIIDRSLGILIRLTIESSAVEGC
jgi:hypothetical protein